MDYTYEKLRRMIKDVERKGKEGKLRPEEAALGTAAAYAIDLLDIGKDSGNILDLTIMNEDLIAKCLMAAHLSNIANGKSVEESRKNLEKLLGGYELFAVTNSANIEEKLVEITVLRSVMSPQVRLVIDSLPDQNGETIRFDVYDAARETVTTFNLGTKQMPFFMGHMLPFHNRLVNELIMPLQKREA